MKVYIAGPMRGIKDFNFPAFFQAEERLKEKGHVVFNPARRDVQVHGWSVAVSETGDLAEAAQKGFSLREALACDTAWIAREADAVYLLKGWSESKGAKAEMALALALGLEVWYE